MLKRKYTRRRPYSKLGGGGVPSGVSGGFRSRTTARERAATRYTWLGGGGLPTGYAPGSFAGRDVGTITPVVLTVSNTHAITFDANNPTISQGNVLVVTGIQIQPTTHAPLIKQDGRLLDVSTASIVVSGKPPAITQDNPNTVTLNPGFARIGVSVNNPTIAQHNQLIIGSSTPIYIGVRTPTIVPGSLGVPTLSQADIQAMWKGIQIDGMTPYDILKYMAAVILGKVEGGNTPVETFKAPATGVTRYKSTVDSNGNRQNIQLL